MRVARMMIAGAAVVAIDFPNSDCAMILCGDVRYAQHTCSMLAHLTFTAEHRIARFTGASVCAGIIDVASDSAPVESLATFSDEGGGAIGTMNMRAKFAAWFKFAIH